MSTYNQKKGIDQSLLEEFRPFPGYEKTHLISSLGRVKCISNYIEQDGITYSLKPGFLGITYLARENFCIVQIRKKLIHLHKAVAKAFLTVPDDLEEKYSAVAHRNGNTRINTVANLIIVERGIAVQMSKVMKDPDYLPGVCQNGKGIWYSSFCFRKQTVYLGTAATKKEASALYFKKMEEMGIELPELLARLAPKDKGTSYSPAHNEKTISNKTKTMDQFFESSLHVYWTKKYGLFKFMKGNREINVLRVNKIVKSIKDGFDVLQYAPIIVNENFEIIDGQHRFSAARELKASVYFMVYKGEANNRELVPKINSASANWKPKDFLQSFVDMGNKNYIVLNNILKEHPKINIVLGAQLLTIGLNFHKSFDADVKEHFMGGTFKIKKEEEALKVIQHAKLYESFIQNPVSRRFLKVVSKLLSSEQYDYKAMLFAFQKSGEKITSLESEKTILFQMESILNYGRHKRVMLY